MTISNSLLHTLTGTNGSRAGHVVLAIAAWSIGSGISAELLGYWLHRLLHTGWIGFLSRSHMEHHMLQYGPLRKQRTPQYLDSTGGRLALGNIGLEWLVPAVLLVAIAVAAFHYFHVRLAYQLIYLGITLGWSSLMFSYLHDVMHVEGFWLAKNRLLKRWFLSARRLHDIHHRVLNNRGLMDKNFGIGFFAFDRLFGTRSLQQTPFNHRGYAVARERFDYGVPEPAFRTFKNHLDERSNFRRCETRNQGRNRLGKRLTVVGHLIAKFSQNLLGAK